ncbi:hypothetical protein ACFWHQ_32375 [Streptomyces sp. NPDC060334]|uniref:hypothetical protein n=1 Tax=Streptomyces sp. NPDC060334 TaxID=3347099 RepID=UPI0036466B8F
MTESGRLPPGARPGAEFVVWAAIHGLAVLLIDGLVHIDDRQGVECQTERLVFATFNGLGSGNRPRAGPAHAHHHAHATPHPGPGS